MYELTIHLTEEDLQKLRRTGRLSIASNTKDRLRRIDLSDTQLEELYYSGLSSYDCARTYGGSQMRFTRSWRLLGLDTSIPAPERPALVA